MVPFVVLVLLIAGLITIPSKKGVYLETCPSPLAQNDHLKHKLSLCCYFVMKRDQ